MSDINVKNKYGETPLMQAAERGDMNEVRRLLAAGADVLATDNENVTAAKKAEHAGHRAIAELLRTVEKGGDTATHADIADTLKKAAVTAPSAPSEHVYSSNYRTTRVIFTAVSFVGWIAVVIGGIGFVAGLSIMGGGDIANVVSATAIIMSSFVVALMGLVLVVMGQTLRAVVDIADHTGKMVELLNRSAR